MPLHIARGAASALTPTFWFIKYNIQNDAAPALAPENTKFTEIKCAIFLQKEINN
jgi:uncharacterized membrane protein